LDIAAYGVRFDDCKSAFERQGVLLNQARSRIEHDRQKRNGSVPGNWPPVLFRGHTSFLLPKRFPTDRGVAACWYFPATLRRPRPKGLGFLAFGGVLAIPNVHVGLRTEVIKPLICDSFAPPPRRVQHPFKATATVAPRSAGVSTQRMPAALMAAYLSFAVP
jgi:hypothetical protein